MINKILNPIKRALSVHQALQYEDIFLPINRSNEDLSNNKEYIKSAITQIETLQQYCNLSHQSKLIDFGCGQGRIANGLLIKIPYLESYVGIDTDLTAINWCKRWIQKQHPNYVFIHVNAHNARYNPKAKYQPDLPLDSNSFDVAFISSVFSHMLIDDIHFYLQQINQIIKPQGFLYLTAFIEEGVPDVEENPKGYLDRDMIGPLHRVRYEKSYFLRMVEDSGFEILKFLHQEIQRTKQSVLIAKKNPDQ